MENASKALLIAASVLIVILLIAMGVRVLNSTSGTVDSTESTMVSAEVAQFNNKFMGYFGNNKGKAETMALINLIISHNSSSERDVIVTAKIHKYKGPTGTLIRDNNTYSYNSNDEFITLLNKVSKTEGSIFTIKSLELSEEGYITKINITSYK